MIGVQQTSKVKCIFFSLFECPLRHQHSNEYLTIFITLPKKTIVGEDGAMTTDNRRMNTNLIYLETQM